MSQILLQQFRAGIKVFTQHAPPPAPAVRRRRKEETGKAFQVAAAKMAKRERAQVAVHQAIVYLWDTLDWLNPWQQDAGIEHDAELQPDEAHHLSLHL